MTNTPFTDFLKSQFVVIDGKLVSKQECCFTQEQIDEITERAELKNFYAYRMQKAVDSISPEDWEEISKNPGPFTSIALSPRWKKAVATVKQKSSL